MNHDYSQSHSHTGSTFVTALVGGIIGAAAALFFSDEKRRQSAVQMAKDLPNRVMDARSDFDRKTDEVVENVRRGTQKVAGEVREKAEQVEDQVSRRTK